MKSVLVAFQNETKNSLWMAENKYELKMMQEILDRWVKHLYMSKTNSFDKTPQIFLFWKERSNTGLPPSFPYPF